MTSPFVLGVNFPWVHCGHDFGPRPPQWRSKKTTEYRARDYGEVERELETLRSVGITLARWWILAGGVNYPVGEDIFEAGTLVETDDGPISSMLDVVSHSLGNVSRDLPTFWAYERVRPKAAAPKLPDSFLRDFELLLEAHANAGVKIMPSLLSFEFFQPAVQAKSGVVKRGRSEFVFGPDAEDLPSANESIIRFLSATLEPLLASSTRFKDSIYAWEVVNEPDWVVCDGPIQIDQGSYGSVPSVRWIPALAMDALLTRALDQIEAAGFVGSVGFGSIRQPWLRPSFIEQARLRSGVGKYVHQLHHYPTVLSDKTLHPASEAAVSPCLVGEFPTSQATGKDNIEWQDLELKDSETDEECYLEKRLQLIYDRGYAGALPWSARSGDSRRAWGDSQTAQVKRFASEVGLL